MEDGTKRGSQGIRLLLPEGKGVWRNNQKVVKGVGSEKASAGHRGLSRIRSEGKKRKKGGWVGGTVGDGILAPLKQQKPGGGTSRGKKSGEIRKRAQHIVQGVNFLLQGET